MTNQLKNKIYIAITVVIVQLMLPASVISQEQNQQRLEEGKRLAFERKKGNCLACHMIAGGTLMGNNGPPLIAMKQRYPERQKLILQISDARINNEKTIMPPFGTHGILTKQEIELIADWLLTL